MDKEHVLYTYNGILLSLKKEGNPEMCKNMGEVLGHYTKWNKLDTEGQILHDSTYMRCLKSSKYSFKNTLCGKIQD